MKRNFVISTFDRNGLVKKSVEDYGHDLFIMVGDKKYRFSVDNNDNLSFALVMGQDVKIVTDNGYPAVKLIGK